MFLVYLLPVIFGCIQQIFEIGFWHYGFLTSFFHVGDGEHFLLFADILEEGDFSWLQGIPSCGGI